MSKAKRDLVVHYDEEKRTVICYTTAEENTEKVRDKEFGLEVDLSVYAAAGSGEAERMMGAGIFSLLNLHSNLPADLGASSVSMAGSRSDSIKRLESAAEKGDGDAQYCLAIEYFTEGVRIRSAEKIEKAEILLKKAAENGSQAAASYLNEHWERDKASATRGLSE